MGLGIGRSCCSVIPRRRCSNLMLRKLISFLTIPSTFFFKSQQAGNTLLRFK